jgi:MoaA/NifB/PqqE/SkfB family radical SAM enzyme
LLHTNGTLFERFSPEQIFEWGLDEIVVSIDGTDERSFARLRVGGDLKVLKANLAEFHARRAQAPGPTPRIEVRHVIMPNETPEMLKAFTDYWRGTVADTVKYCLLGTPYDKPREAAPDRPPCRDIRREMHIRFDGRVPLCGYAGHGEWIGDLAADGVSEVWHSDRLNDVRERHRKRDLEALPFCKTCQFC